MDFLSHLLDPSGFIPRRLCGEWTEGLVLLHNISDALIFLSYLAIPLVLVAFFRRRNDVPFPSMFWLFAAFIVSCGFTHFLEVVLFYDPLYRLAGLVKAVTAVASVATVVALVRVVPRALALRSPEALEREVASRTADLADANAALRGEIEERRRAEQALVEERERFRLTLASIGEGVIATDQLGRVTFINDVACALTGWAPGDAQGRSMEEVFRVVHERTRQPVESPAMQALRQGKVIAMINSTVLVSRDGTERPIENCGAPIRGDGVVAGAVLVFRDVAEQRRAVEAHARLANLVESSEDAIIGKSLDGRINSWNPSAERLFGYTAAEALSQPVYLLCPPEQEEEMRTNLQRVLRGERVQSYETVRVRKDGSRVDVSLSMSPVRDAAGRVVGAAKIVRDISHQKKADEALRLLGRAIQAVTQGILITDPSQPDNPIIYASPGFERITGYTTGEVIGQNCRFLQGPKTDPTAVDQMRQAIREGRACSVELLNYCKDGTPFWNALSISPVYNRGERVTHFVGVQIDVTDRRRLEEQHRQAQKVEAVGQLAGGVAHDFNNLLQVITGFGELVLAALRSDDPAHEMVDQMVKAAQRAAGLTRQLLAFSRRQVLAPRVLDLNAVVADLEKMLQRVIGEDVDLHTVLQPELGRVKADPGQIEQIILNLAVNARDAMPQGGKLTVETRNVEVDAEAARLHAGLEPGPHVLLAVSDTGVGMTPDVLAHIFEPFFTTKEQGKGTGLGLSTVYGIVRQAGGHVAFYTEPGVGTTFKVYLPRIEATATADRPRSDIAASPGGTETVLLVEDEEGVRTLTSIVLQHGGYDVLEASDGGEALVVASRHTGPIHLLLSDVVMPVLGGRQLAEQLLPLHPEMKVLFLSGYTDDAVVRHGVLQEKVNFLQKPFTPTALAQKVRDVLDSPE